MFFFINTYSIPTKALGQPETYPSGVTHVTCLFFISNKFKKMIPFYIKTENNKHYHKIFWILKTMNTYFVSSMYTASKTSAA